MEIIFNCPHCKSVIEADSEISGVRAECPACNEIVLVPAPGIEIGMELAGYRIDKRLGVGGMGEVFEATQIAMKRRVALKVLPPGLTNDPTLVGRSLHEVQMAAKLEHPNVVTSFDAGCSGGYYYLAMSFIDGEDLDRKLDDGPLPERECLEICLKVARALEYAWNRFGMLHRDIKPGNIMLDRDGEVKLMDMGIAKTIGEDSNLTMRGSLVGTPYYMSPEQATANAQIDCRSDIYALGATLYFIVTGTKPFDGPNAMSIIAKHLSEPLEPPRKRLPKVSNECNDLIIKMMAKKRDARHANWEELEADVERVLAGAGAGAAAHPAVGAAAPAVPAGPAAVPAGLDLGGDDDIELKPRAAPLPPRLQTVEIAGAAGAVAAVAAAAAPVAAVAAPQAAGRAPTPPPVWAPGPAAATEAKGVKVGVMGAAAAGVLIIVLLLASIWWIINRVKDMGHERELQRKDREIEAIKVVGSIDLQLAKVQAEAQAKVALQQRLQDLEARLAAARQFAAANPGKAREARAKFEALLKEAGGTALEGAIQEEIEKLKKKGGAATRAMPKELSQRVADLVRQYQFGPAASLLTAYRGPDAADCADVRLELATQYAAQARTYYALSGVFRDAVRHLIAGDYPRVEATIEAARQQPEFAAWRAVLDEHGRTLTRSAEIMRRHNDPNVLALGGRLSQTPVYQAILALRQGPPEAAAQALAGASGLLADVVLGEVRQRQLPGGWRATVIADAVTPGQLQTVTLTLGADGSFQTDINGKKPVQGRYRVVGNWLYLRRDGERDDYWYLESLAARRLIVQPSLTLRLTLARN